MRATHETLYQRWFNFYRSLVNRWLTPRVTGLTFQPRSLKLTYSSCFLQGWPLFSELRSEGTTEKKVKIICTIKQRVKGFNTVISKACNPRVWLAGAWPLKLGTGRSYLGFFLRGWGLTARGGRHGTWFSLKKVTMKGCLERGPLRPTNPIHPPAKERSERKVSRYIKHIKVKKLANNYGDLDTGCWPPEATPSLIT